MGEEKEKMANVPNFFLAKLNHTFSVSSLKSLNIYRKLSSGLGAICLPHLIRPCNEESHCILNRSSDFLDTRVDVQNNKRKSRKSRHP